MISVDPWRVDGEQESRSCRTRRRRHRQPLLHLRALTPVWRAVVVLALAVSVGLTGTAQDGEAPNGDAFQVSDRIAAAAGTSQTSTNSIGMRFSLVPSGRFHNGSAVVFVTGFWMAQTEVTQQQYERVMGGNPSRFRESYDSPLRPVENVSWYDAIVYANRLSIMEGLTPAYSLRGVRDPARWGRVPTDRDAVWNAMEVDMAATGYRLPTEAEWEYAARGGPVARSTEFAGGDSLFDVGWTLGNSNNRTHRVAAKEPNELGLFDMTGNVWNWVWDWFATYPDTPQTNPTGRATGTFRVLRGGSWGSGVTVARLTYRGYLDPSSRYSSHGFRLVRNLTPSLT